MNKLNIDEKKEVLTLYIKIPLFNKHIALFWIDKRIKENTYCILKELHGIGRTWDSE